MASELTKLCLALANNMSPAPVLTIRRGDKLTPVDLRRVPGKVVLDGVCFSTLEDAIASCELPKAQVADCILVNGHSLWNILAPVRSAHAAILHQAEEFARKRGSSSFQLLRKVSADVSGTKVTFKLPVIFNHDESDKLYFKTGYTCVVQSSTALHVTEVPEVADVSSVTDVSEVTKAVAAISSRSHKRSRATPVLKRTRSYLPRRAKAGSW